VGMEHQESSPHTGSVKATARCLRARATALTEAGGVERHAEVVSAMSLRTCRAASDPVGTCRLLAVDTCTRSVPFGFPPLRMHHQLTLVLY
jgi:hypothetical protein